MFGRLAGRYDLANDLISFGQHRLWKAKAAALACVPRGGAVLDLCTGTGDLSILHARRVGIRGQVIGVDFCAPMLHVAAERRSSQNNFRPVCYRLVQARAEALPFGDALFDACTVGFGLRNVSDLDQALREVYRVLKPGGRLVSLDVSTPDGPVFGPLYGLYFNRALPLIGAAVNRSRADYTYLPQSALTFPQKQEMCRRMLEAGFGSACFFPLSGGGAAIHVAVKPHTHSNPGGSQ